MTTEMSEFVSTGEMMKAVRGEVHSRNRYGVRFILIKGFSVWEEVVIALKHEVESVVLLSGLCGDADTLPHLSAEELKSLVMTYRCQRSLIVPLAECFRFTDFGASIITEIAQWEFSDETKVYIPLFEADHIFENHMNSVARYSVGELPVRWILRGQGAVNVEVVPFESNNPCDQTVKGMKQYLELWEQGGAPQTTLVTKLAPHFRNTWGNFEVQVFKNGFQVVRDRIDPKGLMREEWGGADRWRLLAQQVSQEKDFPQLAHRMLGLTHFDPDKIPSIWNSLNDDEKWLTWLWGKLEPPIGSYLGMILENSTSGDEFINQVVDGVFQCPLDHEKLEERKILVEKLGLTHFPESFWLQFKAINNSLERLRVLSGSTERERREAVLAVRDLLKSGTDQSEWYLFLEIAFPGLLYYLTEFPFDHELLEKYFRLYNLSKVQNEPKAELLQMAHDVACDQIIWQFPTRESALEDVRCEDAKVLWIDGLGLEWVGLIKGVLSSENAFDFNLKICRTNLPSTTGFNKGWTQEDELERGLDQIAHNYDYSFPESFLEQIKLVEKILQKVQHLLNQYSMVILTSDHGLSLASFHKKNEALSLPMAAQTHKWGRYAELSNGGSVNDLIEDACVIDGSKIILTVHGRFQGGKGPSREIHGGATLEECIVPVIVIQRSTIFEQSKVAGIVISVFERTVALDIKGSGLLTVEISNSLEKLTLRIGSRAFQGISVSGTQWEFNLQDFKSGVHKGSLEYESVKIGDLTFEAVKGIKEKDLGI